MPEDEPAFEYTVKIQRGNGTDDRDTQKAKVTANTVEGLSSKVETVREKLQEWAGGFRKIQPDERGKNPLTDDQTSLEEVSGDE